MHRSCCSAGLAQRLAKVSRSKSFGDKTRAFMAGFSPGEMAPVAPSVAEPRTGLSMGQHTELMAQQFHIAREDQDRLRSRAI